MAKSLASGFAIWQERSMTLSDYLAAEKLKPAQFAQAIGVAPSVIGRLLNGTRGVSLEVALKIKEATGSRVEMQELVRKSAPVTAEHAA